MIRLSVSILLLLAALLTVFPAPEFHLWMLAIAVSEYCWIFALAVLVVFVAGQKHQRFYITGSIISVIACLLFLSPLVQAWGVARTLNKEFIKAFPVRGRIDEVKPFEITKLFAAVSHSDHQTLTYVKCADISLTFDLYPSRIKGNRPCVVVVHGGSWSGGDSKQLPELNYILAQKGYHVVSVNYRMAPKWKSPAPITDVSDCLKYLRLHSAALSIDTNKFVLLGRSAGAQIALLAAYTLKDEHIVGVVDFYGPADMVWGYSVPSNPLIMDSRKVMANYLGGHYPKIPKKYEASSPLLFVDRTVPPTLIIHGENDVLVAYEHSRRLDQKLSEVNIPHYWLQLPWATHGFDYVVNGPGGQLSTYAVLKFLDVVVKK